MSAFGIFALILTTAYIIYFSVVIIRDVTTSRKSAEDNSETETFNATFAEEQSVEVTETENGFAVGDNNIDAVPVAAVEGSTEPTASSEAEKEAQVLAIQNVIDAETADIAQSIVHEVAVPDDEYDKLLQGQDGTIDNTGCLITRIPAEESDKTPAKDAPSVDEY